MTPICPQLRKTNKNSILNFARVGDAISFCYGDEENARIYAVHLTTVNQSEIRRAYLVSVVMVIYVRQSRKNN